MFRESIILSDLFGQVGWRQPIDSDYDIVDATNLATASGLYFQDFHSMIDIRMIKESIQDIGISDSNFNTYLTNLQKASIIKVLRKIFSENDLIERLNLFDNENVITETITNGADWVGYEITVPKRSDISVKLNTALLEFDAAGSVTLRLFNSQNQTALTTQAVTTVANSQANHSLTNWYLHYNSVATPHYAGGKFYVGYLTSGLTPKAINRNWQNAAVINDGRGFCFRPCKFAGHTSITLPDIDSIEYTDQTYGLNFDVSTVYDYTNLISSQKHLFVNAIGLQVCRDVMEMVYTSVRSTREERIGKDVVFFELNGNQANPAFPFQDGITKRLDDEISRLRKNFLGKPKLKTYTVK
jgi:hypothetical protein